MANEKIQMFRENAYRQGVYIICGGICLFLLIFTAPAGVPVILIGGLFIFLSTASILKKMLWILIVLSLWFLYYHFTDDNGLSWLL